MSVKSAPYYWVQCDGCGERCDYEEYSAWREADQALDAARENYWVVIGERHYCPKEGKCACESCGKDAGPLAGERDYLCGECSVKEQATP